MNSDPGVVKIRINKLAANIVGNVLFILFCIGAIALAHSLPHYRHAVPISYVTTFMIYFVVMVPVHEALHAIGLVVFGEVRWSDIRFGMMWRVLMPFCHCTVPISLRAYRRMALAPLVVMGPAAMIWLLTHANDWVAVALGLTLASCIGDVMILWKMRGYSGQMLVRDCPLEPGCDLHPPVAA